jgi:hypothetical protein
MTWLKVPPSFRRRLRKFSIRQEPLPRKRANSAKRRSNARRSCCNRHRALVDLFGKVNTLNLDKSELEKTDDKGNLALRLNTQEVSDAIAKTAYVHNMAPGDLADVVMPLLRPVQENMTEVRVRLAQMNTIFNDAPLPDALMSGWVGKSANPRGRSADGGDWRPQGQPRQSRADSGGGY